MISPRDFQILYLRILPIISNFIVTPFILVRGGDYVYGLFTLFAALLVLGSIADLGRINLYFVPIVDSLLHSDVKTTNRLIHSLIRKLLLSSMLVILIGLLLMPLIMNVMFYDLKSEFRSQVSMGLLIFAIFVPLQVFITFCTRLSIAFDRNLLAVRVNSLGTVTTSLLLFLVSSLEDPLVPLLLVLVITPFIFSIILFVILESSFHFLRGSKTDSVPKLKKNDGFLFLAVQILAIFSNQLDPLYLTFYTTPFDIANFGLLAKFASVPVSLAALLQIDRTVKIRSMYSKNHLSWKKVVRTTLFSLLATLISGLLLYKPAGFVLESWLLESKSFDSISMVLAIWLSGTSIIGSYLALILYICGKPRDYFVVSFVFFLLKIGISVVILEASQYYLSTVIASILVFIFAYYPLSIIYVKRSLLSRVER